jgi:hypothetical protein
VRARVKLVLLSERTRRQETEQAINPVLRASTISLAEFTVENKKEETLAESGSDRPSKKLNSRMLGN